MNSNERAAEGILNGCLCAEPSHDCEESAAVHARDLTRLTAEALENAATAMRDKCVEKVKELRDERVRELHVFANDDNHADDAEYTRAVLFVLHGVVTALESLTLEKEKQS